MFEEIAKFIILNYECTKQYLYQQCKIRLDRDSSCIYQLAISPRHNVITLYGNEYEPETSSYSACVTRTLSGAFNSIFQDTINQTHTASLNYQNWPHREVHSFNESLYETELKTTHIHMAFNLPRLNPKAQQDIFDRVLQVEKYHQEFKLAIENLHIRGGVCPPSGIRGKPFITSAQVDRINKEYKDFYKKFMQGRDREKRECDTLLEKKTSSYGSTLSMSFYHSFIFSFVDTVMQHYIRANIPFSNHTRLTNGLCRLVSLTLATWLASYSITSLGVYIVMAISTYVLESYLPNYKKILQTVPLISLLLAQSLQEIILKSSVMATSVGGGVLGGAAGWSAVITLRSFYKIKND